MSIIKDHAIGQAKICYLDDNNNEEITEIVNIIDLYKNADRYNRIKYIDIYLDDDDGFTVINEQNNGRTKEYLLDMSEEFNKANLSDVVYDYSQIFESEKASKITSVNFHQMFNKTSFGPVTKGNLPLKCGFINISSYPNGMNDSIKPADTGYKMDSLFALKYFTDGIFKTAFNDKVFQDQSIQEVFKTDLETLSQGGTLYSFFENNSCHFMTQLLLGFYLSGNSFQLGRVEIDESSFKQEYINLAKSISFYSKLDTLYNKANAGYSFDLYNDFYVNYINVMYTHGENNSRPIYEYVYDKFYKNTDDIKRKYFYNYFVNDINVIRTDTQNNERNVSNVLIKSIDSLNQWPTDTVKEEIIFNLTDIADWQNTLNECWNKRKKVVELFYKFKELSDNKIFGNKFDNNDKKIDINGVDKHIIVLSNDTNNYTDTEYINFINALGINFNDYYDKSIKDYILEGPYVKLVEFTNDQIKELNNQISASLFDTVKTLNNKTQFDILINTINNYVSQSQNIDDSMYKSSKYTIKVIINTDADSTSNIDKYTSLRYFNLTEAINQINSWKDNIDTEYKDLNKLNFYILFGSLNSEFVNIEIANKYYFNNDSNTFKDRINNLFAELYSKSGVENIDNNYRLNKSSLTYDKLFGNDNLISVYGDLINDTSNVNGLLNRVISNFGYNKYDTTAKTYKFSKTDGNQINIDEEYIYDFSEHYSDSVIFDLYNFINNICNIWKNGISTKWENTKTTLRNLQLSDATNKYMSNNEIYIDFNKSLDYNFTELTINNSHYQSYEFDTSIKTNYYDELPDLITIDSFDSIIEERVIQAFTYNMTVSGYDYYNYVNEINNLEVTDENIDKANNLINCLGNIYNEISNIYIDNIHYNFNNTNFYKYVYIDNNTSPLLKDTLKNIQDCSTNLNNKIENMQHQEVNSASTVELFAE